MNIQEAYKILEVSEDISAEDLKKKYKELAKKYHPDISKDPDKFKQINEAHQLVLDFRANPHKYQSTPEQGGWNVDLSDLFNNGFFRQARRAPNPSNSFVQVKISFHESVLGCEKQIKYERINVCEVCSGQGTKHISNNCDKCKGIGRITVNQQGMFFQTMCDKCKGKDIKQEQCAPCTGTGGVKEERQGKVVVRPGTKHGSVLRVAGQGNFHSNNNFFGLQFTDLEIAVNVEPYKDFQLSEIDIISNLEISLLEALQGVEKTVETIHGNKTIKVPPLSKHKDQVFINSSGVLPSGKHIINISVLYPENTEQIIKTLQS